MKTILVMIITTLTSQLFAQCEPYRSTLLAAPREVNPPRRAISYAHLREADVMWQKRIWRSIDLAEKMNHPLYFPVDEIDDRKSLFQVIVCGIQEGTITAYGNAVFDDEFKMPLSIEQATNLLNDTVMILVEDEEGDVTTEAVASRITSDQIKYYWIKEEWFFDRQRSVMDVRIVGIAPVREKMDEDGITVRGIMPLFWIYFPEARHVFANYDVFNRFNDAERLSFDDLFWKRMFSSRIIKESNVYDRTISEYKSGIDALLEGEGIRNEIAEFEFDLWHH